MAGQLYHSNTTTESYLHSSISLYLKDIYSIMKDCYGPYGSHILIGGNIRSEATKDGKTILSKIITNSSIPEAVHGSIMSVADKQVEEVGDGSTTTVLLLCELYERFRKIIKDLNISPSVFTKTLEKCINLIISKMNDYKVAVSWKNAKGDVIIDYDALYNAIYTSVDGNVSLADTILSMFKELNSINPLIIIETSKTNNHYYELVRGVELEGSIIRPDVFFNGFSRREYHDPDIVLVNGRLELISEFFVDLSDLYIRNDKDLIFVCTGINDTTMDTVVSINNSNPGRFGRICVFQTKSTALNDEFLDMCAALGANPVDSDSFKKAINMNQVLNIIDNNHGSCEKALVTEFCARFNGPKSDDTILNTRIDIINEKIKEIKDDPTSHNEKLSDLEDRLAFLSKNYAKFYVGGSSPQRKSINYELANDGIPQAISCMKHGIVNGCNTVVPIAIHDIVNNEKELYNDIELNIFYAIFDSYFDLCKQIFLNKVNNDELAESFAISAIETANFDLNIRDEKINVNKNTIVNSADTDRAILQNSTDMASLLATSKGFISPKVEFDIVSKGLNI